MSSKTRAKGPPQCPIGTVRIKPTGKSRTRFIKVRLDGKQNERWIAWARWWWLENRGPVPKGMRVIYLDGDTMNNSAQNIGLGTAGDVIFIAAERDPAMWDRNQIVRGAATAAWNRLQGKKRRARSWLPTRWYAVFPEKKQILNRPTKSRAALLRLFGGDAPKSGRIPESSLPFVAMRGSMISKETHAGFRRINKIPADAIIQVKALRLNQHPLIAPNPSGLCQCGCGGTTPKARSHSKDVSLGQHRRFIDGHWHDLRHKTSNEGSKLRQSALAIAEAAAAAATETRRDELLGPAFEAALATLRSTRRIKRAREAAAAACRKYFTTQRSYGHVSVDYLASKGWEPASSDL